MIRYVNCKGLLGLKICWNSSAHPKEVHVLQKLESAALPIGHEPLKRILQKSVKIPKGQLISKCPFAVIVSTKIPTNFLKELLS